MKREKLVRLLQVGSSCISESKMLPITSGIMIADNAIVSVDPSSCAIRVPYDEDELNKLKCCIHVQPLLKTLQKSTDEEISVKVEKDENSLIILGTGWHIKVPYLDSKPFPEIEFVYDDWKKLPKDFKLKLALVLETICKDPGAGAITGVRIAKKVIESTNRFIIGQAVLSKKSMKGNEFIMQERTAKTLITNDVMFTMYAVAKGEENNWIAFKAKNGTILHAGMIDATEFENVGKYIQDALNYEGKISFPEDISLEGHILIQSELVPEDTCTSVFVKEGVMTLKSRSSAGEYESVVSLENKIEDSEFHIETATLVDMLKISQEVIYDTSKDSIKVIGVIGDGYVRVARTRIPPSELDDDDIDID